MQINSDHKYDDILYLPHYISLTRHQMSMLERAAQFSPFAALTGYETAIREVGRKTDPRVILTESSLEQLDKKIRRVLEEISRQPEVTITYFEPDPRKEGGIYTRTTGCVKKVDECEQMIILTDGFEIPMHEIIDLDGLIFRDLN